MRAAERLRPAPSRVLDDPYADLFLGAGSRATLAGLAALRRIGAGPDRTTLRLANWIVCRHRWIDDRLAAALADGVEQVVLLGAGYDTRAHRFAPALAGRPVFEVDHPATSARKARIVAADHARLPEASVTRVEIDFERQTLAERLGAAGFAVGARTFVVWEGVSMYLTREAVKSTLTTVHELVGRESEIAIDFWYLVDTGGLRATAERIAANLMAVVGEPLTFAIHPEDVGSFLSRSGWTVDTLVESSALCGLVGAPERPIQQGVYVLAARPTRA